MSTNTIIDVSYHNGNVNWSKIAPQIDGAIIRCGYGSDGIPKQDDKKWQRNVSECERLGIPYGVYLYSYAVTNEQAKSEAQHALRLLAGHKPSLPVFFDTEEKGTESNSAANTKIFCDIMKAAGYIPGVYTFDYWFSQRLEGKIPEEYVRWIARFGSKMPTVKNMWAWQYTSQGKMSGIIGRVDMSKVINADILKTAKAVAAPTAPVHVQLAYAPNQSYRTAVNLNVRTGYGTNNAKTGKIIKAGTWVRNYATARVGDAIWMYIGDATVKRKKVNQWICADTGKTAYVIQ